MTVEELLQAQERGDTELIIKSHMLLTKKWINRFKRMFPHLGDEIESAGYWGLVKAVLKFKHRGKPITSYIIITVASEIKVAITKYKFETDYCLDNLESINPFLDDLEYDDLIIKMRLTRQENEIIDLIVHGYRLCEISEKLNITRNTLYARIDKIREKYRRLTCIENTRIGSSKKD